MIWGWMNSCFSILISLFAENRNKWENINKALSISLIQYKKEELLARGKNGIVKRRRYFFLPFSDSL
jgi:hypothetical protein